MITSYPCGLANWLLHRDMLKNGQCARSHCLRQKYGGKRQGCKMDYAYKNHSQSDAFRRITINPAHSGRGVLSQAVDVLARFDGRKTNHQIQATQLSQYASQFWASRCTALRARNCEMNCILSNRSCLLHTLELL